MLRVCVIGLGPIGNRHADIYAANAQAQLVGVCDINHERADTAAARHGVPAFYDAQAMLDALAPHRIDLVILAGFMRILTPVFIEPYRGRLLNVHPSLLPKYPGLDTHQRAVDAGDTEAGVTVHFVTQELDGGPPIVQARVPIREGDTAETLAARVIVQEHRIYPMAAAWFLQKRLELTDQGAHFDGELLPENGIGALSVGVLDDPHQCRVPGVRGGEVFPQATGHLLDSSSARAAHHQSAQDPGPVTTNACHQVA